jgi:hypothetical protein
MTRLLTMMGLACALTTVAIAAGQPSPGNDMRAALAVMRAMNTAENAIKQSTGKYVELPALLDHPAMGRVKANLAVNGSAVTLQGAQVRLALTPEGTGYQVMVVPTATCGTAVFSDERGLIYTGKVLDC